MKKEKALKMILPFLMVVALLVWSSSLKKGPLKGRQKQGGLKERSGAEFENFADLITRYKMMKKKAEITSEPVKWGRNPFLTITGTSGLDGYAQNKTSLFVLNGIVLNQKSPVAVVNGVEVGLNGVIEGYTVTEISEEYIILTNAQGVELELKM